MKTKKGFSLIELLIVIAIISILVTILLIVVNPISVIQQTEDAKRRTELNQFKTALQLYFNDHNDYPGSETALVTGGYTRALPESFTEFPPKAHYGSSVTDYDASVELDQPSSDDTTSAARCAPLIVGGEGGDFFICTD